MLLAVSRVFLKTLNLLRTLSQQQDRVCMLEHIIIVDISFKL